MTARAPPADARRAIEARVRTLGPGIAKLQPPAIVAVLATAALWPVAAPLLGAGAAVGVAGGAMGLLGGPGQQVITDALQRLRSRRGADSQAELEEVLLARLEAGGPDSRALRDDMARLLRDVDGVQVALTAVQDDLRDALARGLSELGERWDEFAWVLTEVRVALTTIQSRQAEGLALQRAQLDLQREQLVKTNLLLRERARLASRQTATRRPPPAVVASPYKGLRRFEPEDAKLFFGRERLRAELLARVAESRLLALVGDSGSGKSSLLRAGLVRAVWDGGLPGSSEWPVVLLSPGSQPLEELARFTALADGPPLSPAELRADPKSLGPAARRVMRGVPDGSRLLLAVDQLEELFTVAADGRDATAFLQAMLAVAERPFAAVVVAIRSDFLGRLSAQPGVPEALRGNEVLVGPLGADDLRRIVEGPAAEAGLTVETGLADLIVAEVAHEPGALPLVSHALLATFERGGGGELRIEDYRAAGGVRHALMRTADAVLDDLSPAERAIARDLLLRLIAIADGGSEETRRRVPRSELVPGGDRAADTEAVIARLVDARLLTTGETTVEIAHEALIRHWPALRGWLAEDPAGERLRQRLTAAAEDWRRLGRDPGALYRGVLLESAVEWAARHPGRLRAGERAFLEASEQAESRELIRARRAARRLRGLALALALLVVAVGILASVADRAADRARRDRGIAQRHAAAATSRSAALAAAAAVRRNDIDRALLLALEAYRIDRAPEARAALIDGLQAAPRLRATFRPPGGSPAMDVAISSRADFVVSAGADATVRRWDIGGAGALGPPLRTAGEANAVAVSADGGTIIAASAGGIRIWDVPAGKPPTLGARRRIPGLADIAATSDGSVLALVGSDGSVRLMRVAGLRPAGSLVNDRNDTSTSVAFAPDDRTLASAVRGEQRIDLWDARTAALRTSLPAERVDVLDLALGARVAVAATTNGLAVWDTRSARAPTTVSLPGQATAVALDEADERVAVGSEDGSVQLVRLRSPRRDPEQLPGHTDSVASLAFSPDGSLLASASVDGTTRLWSTAAPSALGSADALAGAAQVPAEARAALSGDGARVIAVAPDGSADLWDARSRRRLLHRRIPDVRPAAVALDDGGRVLATAGWENPGVTLWDLERQRALTGAPDTTHPATSVAIGAHDRLVAVGGADGVVRIWDRIRPRMVAELPQAREDPVDALAFARDGRLLAAAAGRAVRIWRLGSPGRPDVTLNIGDDVQLALAFSPDGRTLASASRREIRLWDVASGQSLGGPLGDARPPAAALAFDGGGLVSLDSGFRATRWETLLTSERATAWRDRLCRAVGRSLSAQEWAAVLRAVPYRPACG